MERKITSLIKEKGPLQGSEIREAVGGDGLLLWQTCRLSEKLSIQTIGKHFLRLDRRVDGFARLSPSILREFLTYSVVGIAGDSESLEQRAGEVLSRIEKISESKLELAYRTVSGLGSRLEIEWPMDQVCFIIAGDIVYHMAHDVPRPERSTGKLVNGSDIDLVVVARDRVSEDVLKKLDGGIYKEKYRLLITPSYKEEIDYIVKKMERVRQQMRFETFKHMVACKILQEGVLLYGSEDLFRSIKSMLRDHGIIGKLSDLERQAGVFRRDAEKYLLRSDPEKIKKEDLYHFYPAEESEEFE